MSMARTTVIKGVNFFQGNVDGKDYDSGKLWIEEPVNETRGSSKGFRTAEYKTTDSSVVRAVFGETFPCTAEIQMDLRSTAKGLPEIVVTSIKPTGAARPQPLPRTGT